VAQLLSVRLHDTPIYERADCTSDGSTDTRQQKLNAPNPYYLAIFAIANLVAASICGALSGALVAHKLAVRRERASGIAARKRDFLSFMQAWKHEVARIHRASNSAGFEHSIPAFADGIALFRSQVEMIRGDFTKDRLHHLDALVSAVSKCDIHDNKKAVQTIDDVISYVDDAA
jgi:hypothetical protein